MRSEDPFVMLLRLGILVGSAAVLWIGIAHAAPADAPYGPAPADMPYGAAPYDPAQMGAPMQYAPPPVAPEADYRLGPTDKIRVTVFGEDDLTGEYQIDGSGFVRMPLVGQIQAAGLTAHALEANIAGMLENGYLKDPKVAVEVTTYRPFYIIGAVNRPGEYPYVSNMSALNAIALAGGFTPEAVESMIYVRPEGSTVETRVNADQATHIHPGDVVRVDTTLFWSTMEILSPFTGFTSAAAARVIP